MKAAIFDLDLTLIDSTIAEEARHHRDWSRVYSLIPLFRLYDGMNDVFDFIRTNQIPVAIVSTAPSSYLRRVISAFSIPANVIVGYHDASPIKPHPAPMLAALRQLNLPGHQAISFGDRGIDIQSSNSAGIPSVACFWGTKERDILLSAAPTYSAYSPTEIIHYLQ